MYRASRRVAGARPSPDPVRASARPPRPDDRLVQPSDPRSAGRRPAPPATNPPGHGSPSKVRRRPGRRASTARAAACASPARSRRCLPRPSAPPTESPRSTSSRCAVSRHQPFGCDSVSTSCGGGRFRQRRLPVAPRRVVHHAIDAPVAARPIELARQDLVAQIFRDVCHVLDDAAIHVDDVERAVRARTRDSPAGTARRSTPGTLPLRYAFFAPERRCRRRSR